MAQLKQKERDAKLSSLELVALQAKRVKRNKKAVGEVRTSFFLFITAVFVRTSLFIIAGVGVHLFGETEEWWKELHQQDGEYQERDEVDKGDEE